MFSCVSPCNVVPYVASRDPDFHRKIVVKRWSMPRPKCECLVCVRMKPFKAPVWDDPVKPEPYRLKDPPRRQIAFQNPCVAPEIQSVRTDSSPPAEWTRRGRRNAVWELELDPGLIQATACQQDTESENIDAEGDFEVRASNPSYVAPRRPGQLPAVGEVAENFQVIASTLHRVCLCTRRNGLQDTCPMTGCAGRPACLTTPLPSCLPSGFSVPERTKSKGFNFILCAQPSNHYQSPVSRKPPSSAPSGNCKCVSSPI